MKHAESKFSLKVDGDGIALVEGKLPTRHQQLWKGETVDDSKIGDKVEMSFDEDVGYTFYWGWSEKPSGHWADVERGRR